MDTLLTTINKTLVDLECRHLGVLVKNLDNTSISNQNTENLNESFNDIAVICENLRNHLKEMDRSHYTYHYERYVTSAVITSTIEDLLRFLMSWKDSFSYWFSSFKSYRANSSSITSGNSDIHVMIQEHFPEYDSLYSEFYILLEVLSNNIWKLKRVKSYIEANEINTKLLLEQSNRNWFIRMISKPKFLPVPQLPAMIGDPND